jgi:hypothetical protein
VLDPGEHQVDGAVHQSAVDTVHYMAGRCCCVYFLALRQLGRRCRLCWTQVSIQGPLKHSPVGAERCEVA